MISTTPIRATSALDFPLSSLAGLKSLTWYYVNDIELGGFRADLLAEIVAPLQAGVVLIVLCSVVGMQTTSQGALARLLRLSQVASRVSLSCCGSSRVLRRTG